MIIHGAITALPVMRGTATIVTSIIVKIMSVATARVTEVEYQVAHADVATLSMNTHASHRLYFMVTPSVESIWASSWRHRYMAT
jgi:hypothetical protein